MKRPVPITVGAVLMVGRVLSGFTLIAFALGDVPGFVRTEMLNGETLTADEQLVAEGVVRVGALGYGVWLAFYLVLAWLVVRGVNWARIAAMSLATISILVPFIDWWRSGLDISLRTTLLSLALDILILLALSSRSARTFARRNEQAQHTGPTPEAGVGA